MNIITDDKDTDLVSSFKWHLNEGYARRASGPKKRRVMIYFHRTILERMLGRSLLPGEIADHINGNRLDNRRENLRLADRKTNVLNRKRVAGTSPYIGVNWFSGRDKWRARCQVNGRQYLAGYYDCPILAMVARDSLAKKLHGDFAVLNGAGNVRR